MSPQRSLPAIGVIVLAGLVAAISRWRARGYRMPGDRPRSAVRRNSDAAEVW